MSPINFDKLLADCPEYADIWAALRTWFERNSRKQYVELAVLLRAFPNIDRLKLVFALQAMIDNGMLATAYRVRSSEGDLLESEFDEPDQIPPILPARDCSHMVPTAEGDIVSGYRWGAKDGA